jgi:hypothetical protein
MNINDNKFEDSGEFEISDEFAEDLKSIYGAKRSFPGEADQAVLAAAGKHLAKKHGRLRIARWAVSAAAAAAVVVFAFVHDFNNSGQMESKMAMVDAIRAIEDIDRNGRVDILDAFKLSGMVESEMSLNAKWDVNGDGHVDSKDVDAVAARAVQL